jgi:hypothetical protein
MGGGVRPNSMLWHYGVVKRCFSVNTKHNVPSRYVKGFYKAKTNSWEWNRFCRWHIELVGLVWFSLPVMVICLRFTGGHKDRALYKNPSLFNPTDCWGALRRGWILIQPDVCLVSNLLLCRSVWKINERPVLPQRFPQRLLDYKFTAAVTGYSTKEGSQPLFLSKSILILFFQSITCCAWLCFIQAYLQAPFIQSFSHVV